MSNFNVKNLRMFHAPGLTEAELAKVLRSGEADQLFLNAIAMLLDPGNREPVYRLQLVRTKSHRPHGATYDTKALVADLRALECESLSRGKKKGRRMDILSKYGVSDRTARDALREADEAAEIFNLLKKWEAEDLEKNSRN